MTAHRKLTTVTRVALTVFALALVGANGPAPPRRPFAAAINHNVVAPLVIVTSGTRVGTGTVISSTSRYSLILTADHIIQLRDSVSVTSPHAHRSAPAQVVREDRLHDLALLRVEIGRLPCFCMAVKTHRNDHIGLASFSRDSTSLKSPIVYTSLDHQINTDAHRGIFIHDATLEDGFSGGPVFEMNNQLLVGVVKGFVKGATVEHIAVDISTIHRFLGQTPYAAEFSAIDTDAMGAPPAGRVTLIGLSVGLNRGAEDQTGPNPALEAIEGVLRRQLGSSLEIDRRARYLDVAAISWKLSPLPEEIYVALTGLSNSICDASTVGAPLVVAVDHHDVALPRHGNDFPFSTEGWLLFGTCRVLDVHEFGARQGDITEILRNEVGSLAQDAIRTGRIYYFVEVGETKRFGFHSSARGTGGYPYERAVNDEIAAMQRFFSAEPRSAAYDQDDAIVNFVYRGSLAGTGFWRPSFQVMANGDSMSLSAPLGVSLRVGKASTYQYRYSDTSLIDGATITSIGSAPVHGPWDQAKANAVFRADGPGRHRLSLHLTDGRDGDVIVPTVNTCGMLQLEYARAE